jgi:hypothetical protein
MRKAMRVFMSPDGIAWAIDVKVPSHSSAMVVFKHPDGETARRDRYAWHNAQAPEAHDPRARLAPAAVLEALTDRQLALLYRRSMPVTTERPGYVVS